MNIKTDRKGVLVWLAIMGICVAFTAVVELFAGSFFAGLGLLLNAYCHLVCWECVKRDWKQ